MSSAVLSHRSIPLPTAAAPPPPPGSNSLGFAVFSSLRPRPFPSGSTRLSMSRVLSISPSLILRSKGSRALIVRSSSEEGEALAGDVEAATAVVEVGENEVAEEQPEGSDAEEEAQEKPPRKPRIKLGDIMGILNKRAVDAAEQQRPVPDIRTGDVLEIKLEVPENRRRLSVYKGIVISKQNAGIHTTIRIRRIIAGIGVEIVFPVYSPNIKEIKVVSHRKVRRARLYYLRDKLPRLSTFK